MQDEWLQRVNITTWIIIRGNKEFKECQDHEAPLEKGFWDRRYDIWIGDNILDWSQHTENAHYSQLSLKACEFCEKGMGIWENPSHSRDSFNSSISFSVAYCNIIWGLSSTAIRFNITAFILPTHYAKFGDYVNVKKKRNVGWNQFLDVITSAQKGCTKSHSLLKIKPSHLFSIPNTFSGPKDFSKWYSHYSFQLRPCLSSQFPYCYLIFLRHR